MYAEAAIKRRVWCFSIDRINSAANHLATKYTKGGIYKEDSPVEKVGDF
jgi:hypothetical protein